MKKINIPVKLKGQYKGIIKYIKYSGYGVIELDNYKILVPNAFEGEIINYEIVQVNKTFSRGRILNWIKKSEDRIESKYSYLLDAGIAPYINLKYNKQLELKQKQVEYLYLANNINVNVAKTIGMIKPYNYRNKTIVPLQYIDDKLYTGFIKIRTRGEILPLDDFYLNDKKIDETIKMVKNILENNHVNVYTDTNINGEFRYIMVRRGYYTKQIMVVLITQTEYISNENKIIQDISKSIPNLESLILNYNPRELHRQLSSDNRTLWGKDYIEDSLLGIDFNIGPNSFYQINPQTTEKLYSVAIEKAKLKKDDLVIDAYCGIGTIGLTVANKVKRVIGIEIIDRAIKDANENKIKNNIKNADFIVGDVPNVMKNLSNDGLKPNVIFVDPPRKGLTQEIMDAVIKMEPERFIYISCNPETAVRDASYLIENGYVIENDIIPIDQFPQTAHTELVSVFIPSKIKNDIKGEINNV